MRAHVMIVGVVCALLAGSPSVVAGDPPPLATELAGSGFSQPVFATAPRGDTQRLFVLEQLSGQIRILRDGAILPEPFLDLGPIITAGGERGLLGLAFHPGYALNGEFFVFYNDGNGDTALARYLRDPADPDLALFDSGEVLLTLAQPFIQHNGGMLFFGRDSYLYVSTGDGGAAGDPFNNAQSTDTLLGAILRLDVDGGFPYAIPPGNPLVGVPGAREEIFAWGLRNPWRFTIDFGSGNLLLGDVGQEGREEIDLLHTNAGGGENFGWRCREGTLCTGFEGCDCGDVTFVDPVYEYDHDEGCAVIGGHVYRGLTIPDLAGTYFFADFCTSRVWSFRLVGDTVVDFTERTTELSPVGGLGFPTAFAQGGNGDLYIVSYAGDIWRIIEAPPIADCDDDGITDADELAQGSAFDVNGNGLPDDCELLLTAGDVVLGEVTPLQFIGAQPGQPIAFFMSTRNVGSGPCFFQGTLCLDMLPPLYLLTTLPADGQGAAALDLPIPLDLPPEIDKLIFQCVVVNGLMSVKSNPVQRLVQGP